MRLGALGSLQRGIVSVRANWQLIFVGWLQAGLTVLFLLLSLLPFYLVLRLEPPPPGARVEALMEWMVQLGEQLLAGVSTAPFWFALISSSAVMLLGLLIYCFLQAGLFGVLAQADANARAGISPPVDGFRVFSRDLFQDLAGTKLWPFFWLLNIILMFWMLWSILAMFAVLAVAMSAAAAGLPSALGVAVALALPLGFLVILLIFWAGLAQASIVTEGAGAWESLRLGLVVLTRRLGAVLVLFLLWAAATFCVAFVFALLSVSMSVVLPALGRLGVGLEWGVQAFQWLITALVNTILAATLVALARGESPARIEEGGA